MRRKIMRRQQLYRVAGLFAVLAIIVSVTVAAVPRVQAATSPVRVPADAEWVNSGILVEADQTIYLETQGVAITAPLRSYRGAISGPDGQWWNEDCGDYVGAPPPCAMDYAPYGALVGRVDPDGSPFLIGGESSFTPPASGTLYLAVNDNENYYMDNLAGFTVLFPGK
jgi:hypothetical protein